jgi:hypothetical protein
VLSAHEQTVPQGVLALQFIASIEPVEGSNRRLMIATPLRTYLLKAKHEVAMLEWINAIRAAKDKREKTSSEMLPVGTQDADDAPAITGR